MFGQGSGPILLHSLECSGMESALVNCSHSTTGSPTCSHFDDAGVRCNEQQCKNVISIHHFHGGYEAALYNYRMRKETS